MTTLLSTIRRLEMDTIKSPDFRQLDKFQKIKIRRCFFEMTEAAMINELEPEAAMTEHRKMENIEKSFKCASSQHHNFGFENSGAAATVDGAAATVDGAAATVDGAAASREYTPRNMAADETQSAEAEKIEGVRTAARILESLGEQSMGEGRGALMRAAKTLYNTAHGMEGKPDQAAAQLEYVPRNMAANETQPSREVWEGKLQQSEGMMDAARIVEQYATSFRGAAKDALGGVALTLRQTARKTYREAEEMLAKIPQPTVAPKSGLSPLQVTDVIDLWGGAIRVSFNRPPEPAEVIRIVQAIRDTAAQRELFNG